jgi:hypothetical protein
MVLLRGVDKRLRLSFTLRAPHLNQLALKRERTLVVASTERRDDVSLDLVFGTERSGHTTKLTRGLFNVKRLDEKKSPGIAAEGI